MGAVALAGSDLFAQAEAQDDPAHSLAAIEKDTNGRLGVYARDTGDGRTVAYRAGERFPMCSTFKVLAVGAVLQRVDRGQEQLDRRVPFGKSDLLEYAPVTTAHVAEGSMTVEELCSAAIVLSDNTAANLLLRTLGGPEAVTAFVRARPFDDATTRLDRTEPALNSAIPGDPRDTTAPAQMASDLAILLTTNDVLNAASSGMLEGWMRHCKTGLKALRAGVPAGWIPGDKSGSGANGTQNDVAIFRRPHLAPLIVTAYLTGASGLSYEGRNAALARVGAVIAASFSSGRPYLGFWGPSSNS
jgi:beta-lactamase class A